MPGDIYYNVHRWENGHEVTVVRDVSFQVDAVRAARKAALEYGAAYINEYTPEYGLMTVYEVSRDDVRKRRKVHSTFSYSPRFERELAKELAELDRKLGRAPDPANMRRE